MVKNFFTRFYRTICSFLFSTHSSWENVEQRMHKTTFWLRKNILENSIFTIKHISTFYSQVVIVVKGILSIEPDTVLCIDASDDLR